MKKKQKKLIEEYYIKNMYFMESISQVLRGVMDFQFINRGKQMIIFIKV